MASEKVVVPDIGGSEGAEVIELLVAVGDEVSVDQGLIVLESDKASMEIPSTAAGKVTELFVAEGDQHAPCPRDSQRRQGPIRYVENVEADALADGEKAHKQATHVRRRLLRDDERLCKRAT